MLQILSCKVSATFVVQIWKGIKAPLSLLLACLLITRSGVMLAASSKVKEISRMGTFLRFKRCAKTSNSTPVSSPSRIKVLELDSLMRGNSKRLFTRREALVLSCWLISFFDALCGTWEFVQKCICVVFVS